MNAFDPHMDALTYAAAFLVPFLVGFLARAHMSANAKRLLAAGVSVAATVASLGLAHKLDLAHVPATAIAVFVGSQGVYHLLQVRGVVDYVTGASPTPPRVSADDLAHLVSHFEDLIAQHQQLIASIQPAAVVSSPAAPAVRPEPVAAHEGAQPV